MSEERYTVQDEDREFIQWALGLHEDDTYQLTEWEEGFLRGNLEKDTWTMKVKVIFDGLVLAIQEARS